MSGGVWGRSPVKKRFVKQMTPLSSCLPMGGGAKMALETSSSSKEEKLNPVLL